MAAQLAALRAAPYAARATAFLAASLGVSEWVRRTVAAPQSAPAARCACALPALTLYTLLPLAFDPATEVIAAAVSVFALAWLAAFKTVGAAVGRGPLTDGAAWSPPQFAFALLLPVTVHVPETGGHKKEAAQAKKAAPDPAVARRSARLASAGDAPTHPIRRVPSRSRVGEAVDHPLSPRRVRAFLGKLALLAFTAGGLTTSLFPPGFPTAAAYVFALYALLGVIMDGPATAAAHAVGLTLSPHFDAPFLSRSFGDLWGRRWNLVAGHALRFLVFDPVVDGSVLPPRPDQCRPRVSRARRAAALTAAFFVSGAIHEVILFYVTPGVNPYAGYWLLYFTSQAAFLIVESAAARAWARAGLPPPPRAVAVAAVVGGGLAWAHAFFLPPAVKTDLADRVLASLQSCVAVGRG